MKYDEMGYDENGFDDNGVHLETGDYYDPKGFTKIGMHRKTRTNIGPDGYSREGYDSYGYDREGYKKNGYHKNGIHKLTGTLFALDGFDKNGYDESGYNIKGLDKNGYNRDGFDERGYDKYGYRLNHNYYTKLSVMDNDEFISPASNKQRQPKKNQLNNLILTEQTSHSGTVCSAVFSHNGKFVVSSAKDQTIRIWEVSSGICLRIIRINASTEHIEFSLDDKYILASPYNNGIGIWEVSSGVYVRHIITGVLFRIFYLSPKGKYIVTCGVRSKNKIFDYISGDCLLTLDTAGYPIYFSPDEKFIAFANNNYISLLSISTGKLIKKLAGAPDIANITFSEDGRFLMSYSDFEYRYSAMHHEYFNDIAGTKPLFEDFCEDEDDQDDDRDDSKGLKQIWDLVTGKCISAEFYCDDNVSTLPFENDNRLTSFSYSPNSQYAVTSSGETLKLWDLSEKCCVGLLGKPYKRDNYAKYIPAILEEQMTLKDFVSELQHAVNLEEYDYYNYNINCFRVHSEKSYLIIGLHYHPYIFTPPFATATSDNYQIHIWNKDKGTCLRKIVGHLDTITSIFFIPESDVIISASDDHTIKLWNMHSGECLCTLNNEFSRNTLIAVSPGGRYILSLHKHDFGSKLSLAVEADKNQKSGTISETISNGDYVCKWWDLISGECLKEQVLNFNDNVVSIRFTSDGRFFVTHAINGIERYWDRGSENWLATVHRWEDSKWVVVTPDGKYDSSGDGECKYLRWTMGMDSYPVETFKNEFYVPGLLSNILKS